MYVRNEPLAGELWKYVRICKRCSKTRRWGRLTVEAGINVPKPNRKQKQRKAEVPPVPCKHYRMLGHARITHHSCGMW